MATTIQAKEVFERIQAGETLELVDVRTPVEYQEIHTPHATNVPLDRLDPKQVAAQRKGPATEPIYLVCKSGTRSNLAAQKLEAAGFLVVCIDGGMNAWDAAGLPVVRGKKAISLERQVRIAAGTLVLVGAVLGLLVDPWFVALSGFVGAGLVFAGITDTCGMGMLLARMPWNQVSSNNCCAK